MKKSKTKPPMKLLPKAQTGIRGLDEITEGGLPKGRPTLICGSAGCGKTLMAMEFLVHGATEFDEAGVFMAFEETGMDLTKNVRSLGFDLPALVAAKKLAIDHVHIERSEIEETGEYDLEGLFVRLNHAIDSIGAKRVVLDTIEALFSGLPNPAVLRAELRRLFRWLKEKGVTAIITGERGDATLTRFGIEEYVSDCVVVLDHRINDQISTRRLRVVKYRGSTHGTNEYPFLIEKTGIIVLPVTSLGLAHEISDKRISTGVERLDKMLGGKGYFRGSTVLISGTAGTGKSSMAAHFADATCRRGERCLVFLFEEAPSQVIRNMRSIGIDLEPWVKKGLLHFHAVRPSFQGMETHLATSLQLIKEFDPDVVVFDPISAFMDSAEPLAVKSMLMRTVDTLKGRGITFLMTSLAGSGVLEQTDSHISSLVDTWLYMRDLELNGERNRGLYVLKSRGMAHSNQIREFRLTNRGVELSDVYVGPAGVLTGSARQAQEAREKAERLVATQEIERQQLALERKREALESKIEAMRAEFAADEVEAQRVIQQEQLREDVLFADRSAMFRNRRGDRTAYASSNGR